MKYELWRKILATMQVIGVCGMLFCFSMQIYYSYQLFKINTGTYDYEYDDYKTDWTEFDKAHPMRSFTMNCTDCVSINFYLSNQSM